MFYLFEKFGDYSVEAMQVLAIACLLFSKNFYAYILIYIFGVLINFLVNKTLKGVINEKMPSGHFQSIFYSLSFVFFVFYFSQKKLFYKFWIVPSFLSFIIIILCFHNCIQYHYHSLLEIFTGALTGTIISYLVFRTGFATIVTDRV